MIDYLRLCRLYYALPMASILTLTIWYAMGEGIADHLPPAIYATIALAMVISGGYVLNDVCDRCVDLFNVPDRPIPAGRVSPLLASLLAVGLLVGGLGVALLCRRQFLAVLAVVTVLLVFYDLTSKHLGIGKQLLVAALMTSFYPLAFAQAGNATSTRVPTLYVFPVWIFLSSFGYEILKDIRDVRGDRAASVEPTWVRQRPRLALVVARIAVFAGALILLAPGFLGCGWIYRAFIPAAMLLAIASVFLPPRQAIIAIYGEFVAVGIAATADIVILGS